MIAIVSCVYNAGKSLFDERQFNATENEIFREKRPHFQIVFVAFDGGDNSRTFSLSPFSPNALHH